MKRELKALHNLSQSQVMSNPTYLIDRRWVKTLKIQKTIRVKGGTVPSTVIWYEIAALGIERIEGESEFKPPDRYAGINITATGSNIITLGDGNVVSASYGELHSALTKLQQAVVESKAITEAEKLDLSVDIEGIEDQLAKSRPDKTTLGHLWSGVEKVVTGAGLVEVVQRVAALIAPLVR